MTGYANDVMGRCENGAEGKPSRPRPLDVCSTEDHDRCLIDRGDSANYIHSTPRS